MHGQGKNVNISSQWFHYKVIILECQKILNKQRLIFGIFILSRFKTTKKNLKIKPVMIEDTGIYICKGTNGFGSEEIRIDLIVIGKHTFSKYCILFIFLQGFFIILISDSKFQLYENINGG